MDVEITPGIGQVYFVVETDLSSRFIAGFVFQITGNSGYVGTYTVAGVGSSATVVGDRVVTRIPVVEGISGLSSSLYSVVPASKIFYVNHPVSGVFAPGATITLTNNSNGPSNGSYTIVSAVQTGTNAVISVDVNANSWSVAGNYSLSYPVGKQVMVSAGNSSTGNGMYTISSVAYVGGVTTISVLEDVNDATVITGKTIGVYQPITILTVSETVPVATGNNGTITIASNPVAYDLSAAPVLTTPLPQGVFNLRFTIAGDHVAALTPYISSGNGVLIKNNNVLSFNIVPIVAVSLDNTAINTWVTVQYSSATTPVISATGVLITPPISAPYGYVQYQSPVSASPLKLIGQGSLMYNDDTSWGQVLQNNLINVLENFAHTVEPTAALVGQTWFDTAGTTQFKLNDLAGQWQGVVVTHIPVSSWVDFNSQYVYDPDIVYRTGTGVGITFNAGSTGNIELLSSGGITLSASGNITFDATSTGGINLQNSGGITLSDTGGILFDNTSTSSIVFGTTSTGGITLNNTGGISLTGAGDITFSPTSTGGLVLENTGGITFGAASTGGITINGTGDIALTNTGSNLTLAGGDISLSGDSSVLFSGTGVINMNGNRINNLGLPALGTDGANKAYVDGLSSGIIWISPVLDPTLYDDSLATPPITNGTVPTTAGQLSIAYHKTYIVPTGATGDWVGLEGRAVQYVYDDPTTSWKWVDILNRLVAVNDRFIVFGMPDQGDDLTIAGNLSQGGLTGQTGKVATVTGVGPLTYSFAVPSEPYAVSVTGTSPGSPVGSTTLVHSAYLGYSFTFRGTWGTGAYGAGHQWIQFNGPQALIDGSGLRYTGNILNIGQSTGIIVNANDVAVDPTYFNSNYLRLDGTNTATGKIETSNQLISTIATGTPPLVVSSTTNVLNLNASSLNGATFAAPGPIGSTTANTGAFTTLTLTTALAGQYGGTGVDNTGKTITLGGNLTTLGAFTTSLTVTGNTAVTLPTSGTLVGSSDIGTVTNTMLANSTISGIALGSNLNALTIGTGLSGTTYNGSAGVTIAVDSTVATLTGAQTLTNKTLTSPKVNAVVELTTIDATGLTGVVNVDVITAASVYYTADAVANWTFNFRGNGATSLDSTMAVGESITVKLRATNGVTPYYPSAHQIDGSAVTPKFAGGVAFAAGTASAIDQYTYVITKTAAATFVVLTSATFYS